MGLHHRDMFGMIPFDDLDPLGRFGIHSAASATGFSGPAHWRDSAPASTRKTPEVREVDLSLMKYLTPLLYSQIHGEYIKRNDDIDEANHQWEVNLEEYSRDVMEHMPYWVQEYAQKFNWLHDAKVTKLGEVEEDDQNINLERITFRFDPDPSLKSVQANSFTITFKGVWINERQVLPRTLRSESKDADFLYDEFSSEMISPGVEELSYTFFCSDGNECTVEGIYGIDWKEIGSELVVADESDDDPTQAEIDAAINAAIGEALKEEKLPQAAPIEPEGPKKKPTRGKGKNGVRLFTLIFKVDDDTYFEQIKSKDWSTVWADFLEVIVEADYFGEDEKPDLRWEESLIPVSKNTRNIFMGKFWIDGQGVDVTIVNTKRGPQHGAEEFLDLPPYIA